MFSFFSTWWHAMLSVIGFYSGNTFTSRLTMQHARNDPADAGWQVFNVADKFIIQSSLEGQHMPTIEATDNRVTGLHRQSCLWRPVTLFIHFYSPWLTLYWPEGGNTLGKRSSRHQTLEILASMVHCHWDKKDATECLSFGQLDYRYIAYIITHNRIIICKLVVMV